MKTNIGKKSDGSNDRRPWQKGKAKGKKDGKDVQVDKEWLIDTGAELSCITESNARNFDLTANGVIGGGHAGTAGDPVVAKDGVTMKFRALKADGTEEEIECSITVYVVPDRFPEILGNDQLAKFGLGVAWNPKTRAGKIFRDPPNADGNLRGNPRTPGTRRPGQAGTVTGKKAGAAVTAEKEWLVDTGADVSYITPENAAKFDLTDAPGGKKRGVTMRFHVTDEAGNEKAVDCSLDVTIGSPDILGMDQLEAIGAEIVWNPDKQKGRLYLPKAGEELKPEPPAQGEKPKNYGHSWLW
ncbi:MAG TPA: hypothetical protein VFF00_00050 [Candidatus Elarobacter sp.]|nr:hypothetical protein [Candidatus Elarobacter sp.]